MLTLALFILLTAVALPSVYATPALLTRVTVLTFLSAAALAANAYSWEGVGSGLGLYSGLIDLTGLSLAAQVFLLFVGAIALVQWAPHAHLSPMATPRISTYPLFALLSSMGGCFLVASGDMVTLYLALELQSFAVYVLAALYRDSESATHSGLLYFLLGGLSSCLILLGFAVVYNQTGITNLESLVTLLNVSESSSMSINWALALGFTAIMTGLLFKVTAAPFHNWGPDVYDGVPTIVTTWIAVLPKISLLTLLYTLSSGLISAMLVNIDTATYDVWALLLLMSSTLSLVVGAVVGLAQRRIKRLLAYSTISHVGFMLLAISVNSPEATSAFVFYLVQYTLTAILSFSLLGAISHSSSLTPLPGDSLNITHDVSLISQLAGLRVRNIALAFSLLVLLFSLAGVPPLLGFFGKLEVLYSAISASYYLNVIRVSWFETSGSANTETLPFDYFSSSDKPSDITAVQSYTISLLTAILVFYMASPSLLLDSARLLALSLFSV